MQRMALLALPGLHLPLSNHLFAIANTPYHSAVGTIVWRQRMGLATLLTCPFAIHHHHSASTLYDICFNFSSLSEKSWL